MFELIFVWIVSILALGFGGLLVALLTSYLMTSLGRVVFVEEQDLDISATGHSAA